MCSLVSAEAGRWSWMTIWSLSSFVICFVPPSNFAILLCILRQAKTGTTSLTLTLTFLVYFKHCNQRISVYLQGRKKKMCVSVFVCECVYLLKPPRKWAWSNNQSDLLTFLWLIHMPCVCVCVCVCVHNWGVIPNWEQFSELGLVKLNSISLDVCVWWIPSGVTLHYKLSEGWLTSGAYPWPRCGVKNNPVTFKNENNLFAQQPATFLLPNTQLLFFFYPVWGNQ